MGQIRLYSALQKAEELHLIMKTAARQVEVELTPIPISRNLIKVHDACTDREFNQKVNYVLRHSVPTVEVNTLSLQREILQLYSGNPFLDQAYRGERTIEDAVKYLAQEFKGLTNGCVYQNLDPEHNSRVDHLDELLDVHYLRKDGIAGRNAVHDMLIGGAATTVLGFGALSVMPDLELYRVVGFASLGVAAGFLVGMLSGLERRFQIRTGIGRAKYIDSVIAQCKESE